MKIRFANKLLARPARKAERPILEALTQLFPDALTKEEVPAKAGYEANGGGFNNLGRLRTLELVEGLGEL